MVNKGNIATSRYYEFNDQKQVIETNNKIVMFLHSSNCCDLHSPYIVGSGMIFDNNWHPFDIDAGMHHSSRHCQG